MTYRISEMDEEPAKLDARDKQILAMLSEDSRIQAAHIAKKVRLSRDAVAYRIKKMQKLGVILGFVPLIDLSYFGYLTFHIFMVLDIRNEQKKQELINVISKHPNTKSVMEYHDTWDLEWVLIAKDVKDFDNIIINLTKDYKDVIVKKDKLVLIKGFKSIQLPGTIYKDTAYKLKKIKTEVKQINLDEFDYKLIKLLCKDCRLSTYELSEKLECSPDTIGYRIKKLTGAGIIHGFTVLTNLSKLGYHWYSCCFNVKTFDINNDMKFREFISNNPYILRAVKVLGDWDLVVYMTVDSHSSFHQTFKAIQSEFLDIISGYETWIGYREHAYNNFPDVISP